MNRYKDAWDKLLKTSVFPWWEWSVTDNKVIFNDLKVTVLGFDPEDFKAGGFEVFTELIHPDDHEKAMDAMRLVLSGRTNLYQIDYRIKTIKGDYLWFMDRGIVIERDQDGKPLVIRGVVIDLGRKLIKGGNVDALISVFNSSCRITRGNLSFITLCSVCQKIKQDEEHWIKLPKNISELIGEKISHGICPSCLKKLYPDIADQVIRGMENAPKAV
ncbi:MAG: PAS domain-containing protein [Candidatus Marinimicrobia bacterium]|nr:PAS domain-containing protein [Candidatus Neomarinimicrobiota bacterium]